MSPWNSTCPPCAARFSLNRAAMSARPRSNEVTRSSGFAPSAGVPSAACGGGLGRGLASAGGFGLSGAALAAISREASVSAVMRASSAAVDVSVMRSSSRRHCEERRDEAIQEQRHRPLDCFASLAMTWFKFPAKSPDVAGSAGSSGLRSNAEAFTLALRLSSCIVLRRRHQALQLVALGVGDLVALVETFVDDLLEPAHEVGETSHLVLQLADLVGSQRVG